MSINKLFLVATILVLSLNVAAQTTTFTYQGRLTEGGAAANGTYEMQFKLTDLAGVQVGSTITLNTVTVANGVFTVFLSFGSSFTGADRTLEIGVRPSGSGDPFTVLAPRQIITSTPYAIRAITAGNANQLGGVPASQYVLTDDPRLATGNTYIQNSSTQQVANFNISGNGSAGGSLSASTVNAASQFNRAATRVLWANESKSTMLGFDAGKNVTPTAANNTLVGWGAGAKVISQGNTMVGTSAGADSTADFNTFVGYAAGQSNVSGARNSFFGVESGSLGTANNDNTFFGFRTGVNAKLGGNSFFGSEAGYANAIGGNNSFFGMRAGKSNVNGFDNAFFGADAGIGNTNGGGNSFFGGSVGRQNTTGSQNSFFGYQAGNANVTADDNSYFGYFSGGVSTGAANSFFGSETGHNNTIGFANAFFGRGAGDTNTSGFNNTFVGRGAGAANDTGNSNTVVGAFANVASGALSFATAIGAGATVSTSNTVVLGRSNDTVQVPGQLTIPNLGNGGLVSLCRNAVNQISTCSSSLRYKKDLAPFTRGLAVLNSLKPITFHWKADNSLDLGFGAEEVAAIEPLLVTRNEAGQVEGVKYDRITAVLVNAIKEQQAQIQQQQQQIDALKQLVCERHRRHNACR